MRYGFLPWIFLSDLVFRSSLCEGTKRKPSAMSLWWRSSTLHVTESSSGPISHHCAMCVHPASLEALRILLSLTLTHCATKCHAGIARQTAVDEPLDSMCLHCESPSDTLLAIPKSTDETHPYRALYVFVSYSQFL